MTISALWARIRGKLDQAVPHFNSVPAWVQETSLGLQLQGQAQARWREERAGFAAAMEAENETFRATYPPLAKELEVANAEAAEAERVWMAARDRRDRAAQAAQAVRLSHGHRLDRIRGDLRRTAPPILDGVIEALQEEWNRMREAGIETAVFGPRNIEGKRPVVTNLDSFNAYLAGLRAAAREVERLKGEPVSEPTELLARLEEIIMGSIPELRSAKDFIPSKVPPPEPPVWDDPDAVKRAIAERYGH